MSSEAKALGFEIETWFSSAPGKLLLEHYRQQALIEERKLFTIPTDGDPGVIGLRYAHRRGVMDGVLLFNEIRKDLVEKLKEGTMPGGSS